MPPSVVDTHWCFPCWKVDSTGGGSNTAIGSTDANIPDCYRMLHKRGEGILIDPGSYDNLVGSGWSRRQDALARAAGQKASQYTPCDLDVGGVGTGVVHSHRQVTHQISCPMLCGAVCEGTFTASEIESDVVPALIGLRALTKMRCILDVASNRLIVPGPGVAEIKCPAGTREHPLEQTQSGHLMMPCSDFACPLPEEWTTLYSGGKDTTFSHAVDARAGWTTLHSGGKDTTSSDGVDARAVEMWSSSVDKTTTTGTSQTVSSPIDCRPSQPTGNQRRRNGWLLGDTLMRWTDALTASCVDVTRSGDFLDLSNYECFHSWLHWLYEEPPSFVLIQMLPSIVKHGTRVNKLAVFHLRAKVKTCTRLGVALFMVGSTTLQPWNFTELRKLRPHLEETYARWCKLNVTHDDDSLSSVSTCVWCNLKVLPDLSKCKHKDEVHAADAGSDKEKQYARSFAFSFAFSKLVTTCMDSVIHDGVASWTSRTRPELNEI